MRIDQVRARNALVREAQTADKFVMNQADGRAFGCLIHRKRAFDKRRSAQRIDKEL